MIVFCKISLTLFTDGYMFIYSYVYICGTLFNVIPVTIILFLHQKEKTSKCSMAMPTNNQWNSNAPKTNPSSC